MKRMRILPAVMAVMAGVSLTMLVSPLPEARAEMKPAVCDYGDGPGCRTVSECLVLTDWGTCGYWLTLTTAWWRDL